MFHTQPYTQRTFRPLGVMAVAFAAAACNRDVARPVALATASVSLARAAVTPVLGTLVWDSRPGMPDMPGRPAPLDPSSVDSLIVTVERVDLIPAHNDSLGRPDSLARGMHGRPGMPDRRGMPGRPGMPGEMGGRRDTTRVFFSLEVVGNGRVDLMHLPTEAEDGIALAVGDVPAGDYGHVRLMVGEGQIWLNAAIVTPSGDTLPANTPIPVLFPSGWLMAHMAFTVPEAGDDVPLVFDQGESLAHVVLTGNGQVVVTPVLRHRRPRP